MLVEKPREIAVRLLQRHATGVDYVENLLDDAFARSSLAPADRGLVQELTFGVVRWQSTLDWLIAQKTQGRAQKVSLQILLRLGLYQMFWLDRIPDHAAVHETVEIAKRLGLGPQAGFINAVLRGYLREREATEQKLQSLKTEDPALGLSHPAWLCERWSNRWRVENLRPFLEWNNTPPKTFARINTLKTDAGKLLPQWRDEDVDYFFFQRDWTGENLIFELKSHPPLASLPSFQKGLFYIQDPSTLLSVKELDPQPGDQVLDLCAAPGGKTTFIAQLMRNQGRVAARDNAPDRLKLIQENCTRLGVTCVEPGSTSDLAPRPSPFDKILVDVPCSNTGVMRRRVDLRWRLRPEEIKRLRSTQLELLRAAAGPLKKGGTLVYSTCSLEPEENGEVVKTFLSENAMFQLQHERQLLPFTDGVDGAYVARITRVA